jgi:ABC-type sugar transport system ATPase subunit
MRAELAKLQQRLQTTTVYVTHDQVEAMTLGHRIAVLAPMAADRKTNLKQVGTPLELYDTPANLFVAKFIGTPPMNILPVVLADSGRCNSVTTRFRCRCRKRPSRGKLPAGLSGQPAARHPPREHRGGGQHGLAEYHAHPRGPWKSSRQWVTR